MNRSALLLDVKFALRRGPQIFRTALPDHHVIDWESEKAGNPDLEAVRYAAVWKPDAGLMERLPNLEVIFSGGAGVDHLVEDGRLPDKPIVRFVDPNLTGRMTEWVVLQVLMHLRQQRAYDANQNARIWRELDQPAASEVRVGIMGLGELGQDAARVLGALGFQIRGWSRSEKSIRGVQTFAGETGLAEFLGGADILVCLLPLTHETRGLIDRKVIEMLARDGPLGGPIIINAGRGGSQVESDIIAALRDGALKGVSLDVFEEEPLDTSSPLWDFPNAILTPHAAAVSDIAVLARHVAGQIARYESGKPLEHLVDPARGY